MSGVAIDTLAPRDVTTACSDKAGARIEAQDALATLDWLRLQPGVDRNRLALLGYSMGAIALLDVVDARHAVPAPAGLRAAVAYYPACRNRGSAVTVPLQILDGDADDWTPAAPCHAFAERATAAGHLVSIATYSGAKHAFDVAAPDRVRLGHRLGYDSIAAAAARRRTLAFLHAHLNLSARSW